MKSENVHTYLVNPYEVLEYVWCPRFIYYWKCLGVPQYEDNRYKVQKGRNVHERRSLKATGSRRERLKATVVATDLPIEDVHLGLKGKVDEVLQLDDGTYAPVDFKFTQRREYSFKTHKIQLCMYALLVEKAFSACVEKGWVVYVRGANEFHEVEMNEKLRSSTRQAIEETIGIIQGCIFPAPAKNKRKCADCTYRKLCPDGI